MPTTAVLEAAIGCARANLGQLGCGALTAVALHDRSRPAYEGRVLCATNGLVGVTNEPSRHRAAKHVRLAMCRVDGVLLMSQDQRDSRSGSVATQYCNLALIEVSGRWGLSESQKPTVPVFVSIRTPRLARRPQRRLCPTDLSCHAWRMYVCGAPAAPCSHSRSSSRNERWMSCSW